MATRSLGLAPAALSALRTPTPGSFSSLPYFPGSPPGGATGRPIAPAPAPGGGFGPPTGTTPTMIRPTPTRQDQSGTWFRLPDGQYGFVPAPLSGAHGSPDQLGGLRPGGPTPTGSPNPFQGNRNPGVFATPAPFHPLQALMQQSGRLGLSGPAPTMPRGPMGSFGLTPNALRPRRQNPFVGRGGR